MSDTEFDLNAIRERHVVAERGGMRTPAHVDRGDLLAQLDRDLDEMRDLRDALAEARDAYDRLCLAIGRAYVERTSGNVLVDLLDERTMLR